MHGKVAQDHGVLCISEKKTFTERSKSHGASCPQSTPFCSMDLVRLIHSGLSWRWRGRGIFVVGASFVNVLIQEA